MIDHPRHPKPADSRANKARRWLRFMRRSEDGQAVIELALVLPILLIVVLGIVDFGRATNYWNDENHTAEVGARYAAVGNPPNWASFPATGSCAQPSTLVTLVRYEACLDSPELVNGASPTGIQSPGIAVCVTIPSTNAAGDPITVKVTGGYKWFPLPKVLGGNSIPLNTITLTGSATMRLEAPAQSWVTSAPVCT